MLVVARRPDLAVGGDDLDRTEVVAAEPEGAHRRAEAAAQCESRHSCGRHLAAGRRQAELLSRAVDVSPRRPGSDPSRPGVGVDLHRVHGRQVDYQPVVAHGTACDLVAAAADAQHGAQLASDSNRVDDVLDVGTASDRCGVPVDQPVPDASDIVIGRVRGVDNLTPKRRSDLLDQRPPSLRVLLC